MTASGRVAPGNTSPRAVLATVCLAQFVVPFMFTAVGVALPAMGRDLGATALQLGLVEQLYALSLAATMLTFGRLGDLIGRKRVFLAGLALFTALTAALALAGSVELLIAQRFAQGLAAAMLLSGSMALVASAFPPEVRGRMLGVVSGFTYAGLTLGPLLGGFVTTHLGWRFVFWMVAPPGAAACVLGLWKMRGEWREARGESMDWPGSALYAVAVSLVMLGASHLGDRPGLGGAMMGAGLLGTALFVALERKRTHPLLDLSLFAQSRFFSLSCLAAMGIYAATLGVMFFLSLYLQVARGLAPSQAGLVLLIQPLIQTVVSPLSGRLADRIAPGRLANLGMALNTAGLVLAALFLGPDAPLWLVGMVLACIGLGVGIFITPNTVVILGGVQPRQYGMASGIVGTMRTLGLALSMTTVTLVFSLRMGGQAVTTATLPGFLSSMQACLLAFAAFSCLGLGASLGRGRKG
jgi:EmrB/QacA subfamily drug resistance transporter